MYGRFATSLGLGLALGLAACGPLEVDGPVRVAVLDLHEGSTAWSVRPATLDSLDSLVQVRGAAATLLGGAKIVVDPEEISADIHSGRIATLDDLRDHVVKRSGRPPRLQFTTTEVAGEAGVLLPLDYHGLALISAYHQLETSRKLALELGMPHRCLQSITTYYEVIFETGSASAGRETLRTNAGFVPLLQAFILVPYDLDDLPLGMNPGVIAHEYGHGLWSCLVEGSEMFGPTAFLDMASHRHMRSLDEGLADYFGALLTGEANFIAASLPTLPGRDMSVERFYTVDMTTAAEEAEFFDPYAAGAVVASALWRISEQAQDPLAVGRAVIASLESLEERILQHLGLERPMDLTDYLDVLVRAIDVESPADRSLACAVLTQRFAEAGTIAACS